LINSDTSASLSTSADRHPSANMDLRSFQQRSTYAFGIGFFFVCAQAAL
jgi:hypothetical protein